MGHDVLYLEDTGKWCYDPVEATFVERGERNASYLARNIEALEPALATRWFYKDSMGHSYGKSWDEVKKFCREADLFLHISASCWMKEEYFAAKKVAFLDSDPMYTQASVPAYIEGKADEGERSRIEMLLRHDVFFTFAENIGSWECLIPKELFKWVPTRQPIVVECFERNVLPVNRRRRVLTTVASWEPAEAGPVVRGIQYRGKSAEFEKFMDLPKMSPIPLELAMSGRAPVEKFRSKGWIMVDAYSVSSDPWIYRDYLASSFGEWSVAKNAYVVSKSGWFSCRSACYLALGVPVVVQDTGFRRIIPSGKGVLPFSTMEEAVEAIEELSRDPDSHSRAALELAREYFRAEKVLGELIEKAMSNGDKL